MKIIITNLSSFYKIELYNRINRLTPLYVIYTGKEGDDRNKDFFSGNMEFDHVYLKGSCLKRLYMLWRILKTKVYDEILLGGWDSVEEWFAAFISPIKKNAVVVESTIFESRIIGLSGMVKKIFMRRVSECYCSGKPHVRLVKGLGFNGEVKITGGVGVFNYIKQPVYIEKAVVKNFLYVGRLIEAKNLRFLINLFNQHPEYNLYIAGFGVLEAELKSLAYTNIHFLGAIKNDELSEYYQKMDVFVLPSLSEPWGLVVEEALNNGLPVLVSNKVGCHEDLVNINTGVVFSIEKGDIEEKLTYITNLHNYNRMRKYISSLDFEKIENNQILQYVE